MSFIDLSHDFYDGMPGFSMTDGGGNTVKYTAHVDRFLSHEQSAVFYEGKASFEITELSFQTSVGTYLDSPLHRFTGGRDIASLKLGELIRPGLCIDARSAGPGQCISLADIDLPSKLEGKAVLFNFGWDRHWETDIYNDYPYIGRDIIDALVARQAAIAGVDTLNIDNRKDPERPAHTQLLGHDCFVCENLRGLEQLVGREFRFFAMPIKVRTAAAMPVRAFAEI